MNRVVVLYEDQRRGRFFGPHEMMCAFVADAANVAQRDVRRMVEGKALKGCDNVLKALKEPRRWRLQAGDSARVVAILDADTIRERFEGRTAAKIEQRIRKSCSEPSRLTVVLLEQNLETVIGAIRDCDSDGAFGEDIIRRALDEKNMNARDVLLGKVAAQDQRSLRERVRSQVPSLDRAITAICNAMTR